MHFDFFQLIYIPYWHVYSVEKSSNLNVRTFCANAANIYLLEPKLEGKSIKMERLIIKRNFNCLSSNFIYLFLIWKLSQRLSLSLNHQQFLIKFLNLLKVSLYHACCVMKKIILVLKAILHLTKIQNLWRHFRNSFLLFHV